MTPAAPPPPGDYIYDIETYPNVFTCSAKHHKSGIRYRFEISHRRNDRMAFLRWLYYLHEFKSRMVGYNNEGFDFPVIDYLINYPDMGAAEIYRYVQTLFDSDNRFGNAVRNPYVEQIDLYKIHDFDRPTKATSLKALEFNMRLERIVDLPFPPGTVLTDAQIETLIAYNDDDVDATERLYLFSQEQIAFRERLTERYGRDRFYCMNWNDPKIGKEYFIMKLNEKAPGACFHPGTRRPRQTIRQSIDLKEVVFPWIQFKNPAFQAVCDWFKRRVISETNGVFTDISEDNLGPELVKYCTLKRHRELLKPGMVTPPSATTERIKNGNLYTVWNNVENLHVVVNGFQFDFGTGGIHGSVSSRIVRSDDEYAIYDLDVASYYPNLAIANRIYPLHLGEPFCVAYEGLYEERKQYAKGTSENGGIKLGLNAVYGQSNNMYSPFYDPQYTMSITINGQLLLCLLADYLMDIPGLEMIQVNTDGLTVRCHRNMKGVVDCVCDWWQKHTRLELECVEYKAMFIRDVNNYIAVSADGKKIKRKGAYAHKFEPPHLNKGNGDLDWHQDHSALIIPKAAEAVLVHNADLLQFIMNHDNIFDFMLRAKVPRNCRLLIDGQRVQNITRYYVVQSGGGTMVKVMPPLAKTPDKERHIGICVNRKVRECNDIRTFDRSLIDYNYYIEETQKLIAPLVT